MKGGEACAYVLKRPKKARICTTEAVTLAPKLAGFTGRRQTCSNSMYAHPAVGAR